MTSAPQDPTADPTVDPPGSTVGDKPPSTGIDGSVFGTDPTCPKGSTDPNNLDCIPIDHYDIWYDGGHVWSTITKAEGLLAQIFFGISRWLIRAGIWLMSYTLKFTLAQDLADPARNIASAYQANVLARFGLPALCLFLGQWWAAIQIARGRLSRGASEASISLIIAALAAGLLSNFFRV